MLSTAFLQVLRFRVYTLEGCHGTYRTRQYGRQGACAELGPDKCKKIAKKAGSHQKEVGGTQESADGARS